MESTPSESPPKIGDVVDVSWFFDNIDLVTAPETDGLTDDPGPRTNDLVSNENEGEEDGALGTSAEPGEEEERFRNVLNYNIMAWENNDPSEENQPKKADKFIQRLCDKVSKSTQVFVAELATAATASLHC